MLPVVLFGFVCLVCSTGVFAVDPTITIKATSPEAREKDIIYATKDKDVTISCFVENLPVNSEVKFKRGYGKNFAETDQISTDEAVLDSTRYGIEKPTPSTWKLRIRSIPVAYAGRYTCFVTTNVDTEWDKSVKVLVYSPPLLNPALTSTDMTVKEGDPVELLCNATGLPSPTIQWKRQGNALLPVGQETYFGSKMMIPNIHSNHRGVYKCSAYNVMGTINRNIEVKVLFKPKVEAIENHIRQAVGYVIELQCLIEANPVPDDSELSWQRGALGFSKDSGRYKLNIIRGAFNRLSYELIINGVTKEDFGDYRCLAKNDLGNAFATVKLSESDVPQNSLKIGKVVEASAVLPCSSTLMVLLMSLVALHFNRT